MRHLVGLALTLCCVLSRMFSGFYTRIEVPGALLSPDESVLPHVLCGVVLGYHQSSGPLSLRSNWPQASHL